jgi:hypothetical protein
MPGVMGLGAIEAGLGAVEVGCVKMEPMLAKDEGEQML